MSTQISRVSAREAFNRVVAESVLLFDCCLTPAELVPGAVALDLNLSPVDVAVSAAYQWAMDELGPEDHRFAVVFDDDCSRSVERVHGREVAEWLVKEGNCRQVWMVDREAFAREYGFILGAPLEEVQAHPQEIINSLFLGSILTLNPKALDNLRITHVVSVMDRDIQAVGERSHIHCRVADSTEVDIGPTIDEALSFIHAALSSGGRVLVHCEQGQSRSASVVIAHILRTTPSMGLGEALALVKSQRPLARPNPGFMKQLQQIAQQQAADSPATAAYRFNLDDRGAWLDHFQKRGYVVISAVADASEVATAKDLLWRELEKQNPGLSRSCTDTWSKWPLDERGIVPSLAQSEGAWFIRGLRKVKACFSSIWDTNDLLVSMDAVLVWRPWWSGNEKAQRICKPVTEGLHLDQNPFGKPYFDCVQGMVPLLPVTRQIGGLEVVPLSHLEQAKTETKRRHPGWRGGGDWCVVDESDPMQQCAELLLAEAGDLILWDSRTVHGGWVGAGSGEITDLARLSCAVAMSPRVLASDEVRQKRREGQARGDAFNHCPHEAGSSSGLCEGRTANIAVLTAEQMSLL